MLQRNRYLINLMRQYSKATGRPETSLLDPLFFEWVQKYTHTLEQLKNHMKSLNINLESVNAYETNKGITDSLLSITDNQVTKYTLPRSIIEVDGSFPYHRDGKFKNSLLGRSNLIYTFNPYNHCDVEDLYPDLYRIGHPIAIAVAGNYNDVDKEEKLAYIDYIYKMMPNLVLNVLDEERPDFYSKIIYSRNATNISKSVGTTPSYRTSQIQQPVQQQPVDEPQQRSAIINPSGPVYGSSLLKYQPKR